LLPICVGFQSLALLSIDARLSPDPNLLRFRQPHRDLRRSSVFGAAFHFSAACAAHPSPAAAINLLPVSTGYQSPAPYQPTSDSHRVINLYWRPRLTSNLHRQ
jgi:hypothetical protein